MVPLSVSDSSKVGITYFERGRGGEESEGERDSVELVYSRMAVSRTGLDSLKYRMAQHCKDTL